ncbi:MAG: glycosyltransferase family 4 protein [Verrucomicrobia bacterium]|nr:glycosyltransferase family 4 protein [Verrucomicrobiota bacterium]
MKSKKQIAILADFSWSFFDQGALGRGGGQACTWLSQLAEEFARFCPYEVHWITIDRSRIGARSVTMEWGGQHFHRIQGVKVSIDLALNYAPSRFILSRALRKIGPDLIHAWGTEHSYPVACGTCGVPSILSMQGVLTNLSNMGYLPNHWYWKKLPQMEVEFLRSATIVTCESQWAIERVLETLPSADTRMVEYGVHSGFYDIAWEPDAVRPYALFVGTLAEYKGVVVLLEAVRRAACNSWTLRIAGDGPLRDVLEACDIPNVEYLGVLPWSDLQQQMKGARCLVHPTLADSSPNVVKEARVIGLPVITTIHGGQAGYIRNGENGIIVEPLSPEGLAEALSRVMDDSQFARRMGATRHAEDRAYFRPENTARGFLEIYDEMLA